MFLFTASNNVALPKLDLLLILTERMCSLGIDIFSFKSWPQRQNDKVVSLCLL